MDKWEYLYVALEPTSSGWHPRSANDVEVKGWKSIKIYDYSNSLGQQGWELVSAQFSPSFMLVFKRLLP